VSTSIRDVRVSPEKRYDKQYDAKERSPPKELKNI
jgi:hypothetical protein